ncbi:AAA family ATPase [Epibacterium ulvae]|uniref:AAA family ATPase n=1 Tax=Epibacterium ulvae TaxID=1156985 RepID=UPI003CD0DC21
MNPQSGHLQWLIDWPSASIKRLIVFRLRLSKEPLDLFIKRVGELKSAGVWKDFSAPEDLCLAPRTLVYGFNGSGKTTLSRVFSSIQRSELEERLPSETTFKVEASDGATTTQKPISNLFGKNLLVFNTDFVSRNFEWDSSSTNGIAYLSEKKVEARREFDELTPKVAASQQATKARKGKKGEAERARPSPLIRAVWM